MKPILLSLSAALLLTPFALAGGAGAPVAAPMTPAPVTVAQTPGTQPTPAPSMPAMTPSMAAPAVTYTPSTQNIAGRQEGFVTVNGARIHFISQGRGPVLFLIHGYPLSGELYSRNRTELSGQYRVVTIDLRGYGESTVSPTDAGSIPTYASDALAVMDALGIQKAAIGGMSMGGPIVFEMYRRAPQRFNALLLIDTTADPADLVEQNLWKGMALQAQSLGATGLVNPLIKDMLSGETRLNNPQQVGFLSNIVRQASVAGDVAGANALANRVDSNPTLATIRVPTLIIEGVEDTVYPIALAKKMQMGIRGSKLVLIPGAAHAATYEKAPEVSRAMMDFLRTVR